MVHGDALSQKGTARVLRRTLSEIQWWRLSVCIPGLAPDGAGFDD